MSVASSMLRLQTWADMPSVISSLGLVGGPTLLSSPDGPRTAQSGPAPARANHSAWRALDGEQMTLDIFGPSSPGSLASANLQSSLESRLRARLDVNGSPEYVLTWKRWDMLSGPPICALRARGHRTSDKGCSGWGTPTSRDHKSETGDVPENGLLSRQVLNGYPTPNVPGGGQTLGATVQEGGTWKNEKTGAKVQVHLDGLVKLAGHPTPRVNASTENNESRLSRHAERATNPKRLNDLPDFAALAPGPNTKSSNTKTAKGGGYRLNPNFTRWLVGFPENWFSCVDWEMLSSRKSRRSS